MSGQKHGALSVGIDLVQISRIAESLECHGERFLHRVFTRDEVAYALECPPRTLERLAARFAAKEATMKVLRIDQHAIGWRDVEVRRLSSGACELLLHGRAAELAREQGAAEFAVSLSHDGDYATAVVVSRPSDNHVED